MYVYVHIYIYIYTHILCENVDWSSNKQFISLQTKPNHGNHINQRLFLYVYHFIMVKKTSHNHVTMIFISCNHVYRIWDYNNHAWDYDHITPTIGIIIKNQTSIIALILSHCIPLCSYYTAYLKSQCSYGFLWFPVVFMTMVLWYNMI